MGSIIVVHGTGVRKDVYDAFYADVKRECQRYPNYDVKPCYWGDQGALLPETPKSIPEFEADEDAKCERDYQTALWGVLYVNPLYELQILQMREANTASSMPGKRPPGLELADKAREFAPSEEASKMLANAGLADVFHAAKETIVTDPMFAAAMSTATNALEEYREAVARAWIAQSVKLNAQRGGTGWLRADVRVKLVDQLVNELGGRELVLSDWLKDKFLRFGTAFVRTRRSDYSTSASPIAGDVLRYQTRPRTIQDRIRTALNAAPPVVVLAHSLGGIAAVDLLVKEPLPVQLLVTVGSQAPYLYEIGALSSLEPNQALPDHFPPWLNIYDPRDFLSYCAAEVFPGRAEDQPVDNGQPFPQSHGAYWENKRVWEAIGGRLP